MRLKNGVLAGRRLAAASLVLSLNWAAGCAEEGDSALAAQTSAILSPAGLQLKVLTASCGANQRQDFFQVVNAGPTAVKLSDISIKLWADDTSGQALVPHVWTGGCVTNVGGNASCTHQVAGATSAAKAFAPACGPDPSHQANWEVTISNTDSSTLPPGAIWNNIQSALNLANFASFTPGTGKWYSSCLAGATYAADAHFAIYYQGNLVFSNGIAAPVCRAPHGSQQLAGHITPAMASAPTVGPVPANTLIDLAIGLPVRDPAGLQDLVRQVSDPTSASYRHYLTPDQFQATLAPRATDYQAVIAWAQSNGFTVTKTFPNFLLLDVSGTAAVVERALSANLVRRMRPDGTEFYVLDREPSLDLTTAVLFISNANDFVVPRPALGSGDGGAYRGNDFRNAYASCTTRRGAGQSVGLIEFDGYSDADIKGYESDAALPNVPVNPVLLDGFTPCPGDVSGSRCPNGGKNALEVALDIEMAIAMAPGLSQVAVFEGQVPNNLLNAMATARPVINQLSSSWNFSTDPNSQQILYQMAAQGQSFFQASGDFGAYAADPADIRDNQAVTVVGGTTLSMNGLGASYSSEGGWPFSGGGVLGSVALPDFQAGIDMALNDGSTTNRNVPDVAMVADGVEVVATFPAPGTRTFVGGTSVAAPLWAAFVALANEEAAANGGLPLGFANPTFYRIAKAPALYALDFNDIVGGFNGTFLAVAGYDLVTGLGSPKCTLVSQLAATNPLGLSFGGAFQTEDASAGCGGDSVPNAVNQALTCPTGFQSGRFGRILTPESRCGASQFFCTKIGDTTPPAVHFGGMFQVEDNVIQDCGLGGCPFRASDQVINQVTGTFGCPTGYHSIAIGRIFAPEGIVGAVQFACEADANDPILESRWIYGGSFQVDDCGEATILNPLTSTPGCPVGFEAFLTGRVENPEGMQCGVNQFACVRTIDAPPLAISFGGAFQTEDAAPGCGGDSVPSPVFGGMCDGTLPARQFGRILTPESKCGATQFICATVGANPSALQFGGMFQRDDTGGGVRNPLNNDFRCLNGFEEVAIGRIFTPEGEVGAEQFACEAPIGAVAPDARQFGGVFQIDDCGQATLPNPIIQRVGCPSGFAAAQFGRAKNPEGQSCGISQFFCFR